MGREIIGLLCALAALLTLCYAARPMGGKFTGERALKQELSVASDNYNVRGEWVKRKEGSREVLLEVLELRGVVNN